LAVSNSERYVRGGILDKGSRNGRRVVDTDEMAAEMQRAAADFRSLLDNATSAELRRGSDGTKWTNEQLLFHMLSGYLVVRTLRVLVWTFGRLPDGFSRAFAAVLNAGTRPFHTINYLGSLGGARTLGHAGMERIPLRLAALRSPSSAAHPCRRRRIIRAHFGPLAARRALRSPGPSLGRSQDLVRGARTLEQVGYPHSVRA